MMAMLFLLIAKPFVWLVRNKLKDGRLKRFLLLSIGREKI
jgi:hypothetical protein